MEHPVARIPIVGVMGSGTEAHEERAAPLGRWLAEAGFHLLTGGGAGVMASVSRAFCQVRSRKGLAIGVIPGGEKAEAPEGPYPNPWVEIPIRTHLPLSGNRGTEPLSRNHINVLSSCAVVVLPGGEGTASEARLAVGYGIPVAAFLDHRTMVPGLPEGVPVHPELSGIMDFVRDACGLTNGAGASTVVVEGP